MYFVNENGTKIISEKQPDIKENYGDSLRDEENDDPKMGWLWIVLAIVGSVILIMGLMHIFKRKSHMSYGSSSDMEANFGFRFY